MLRFTLLFFIFLSTNAFAALEYSKIENPGCPENAYCQKNTGEVRRNWLDLLESFTSKKISETKLNTELQERYGLPIAGWAQEDAGVLPRIMMWDSPCKQHKKEAAKYYISEVFRKNLKESELKEFKNLHFAHAIINDSNKKPISIVIPRGEMPNFIENNSFHFLRDDEGKYYGLFIDREGSLKVTTAETVKEIPKEAVCLKEHIDAFLRVAPSPTFYQGYTCKDIWDKTSQTYKTMLFGWSCN